MDTNGLRENFQNQLKEIDEKIAQINGELEKAKEYKLKLLGGLETLELLASNDQEDTQIEKGTPGPPTREDGMAEDSMPKLEDTKE